MNTLKINETPVINNNSYKINNYSLININLNNNTEFKNVVENSNNIIIIDKYLDKFIYGMGDIVYNNNINNSNYYKSFETTEDGNLDITFTMDSDNINLINNIYVNVKHNTKIKFFCKSISDIESFKSSYIKIDIHNNINVSIDIINLTNNKTINLDSLEIFVYESSSVELNVVDLGSNESISNVYFRLIGNKSNINLNNIYMLNNSEIKDINIIADIIGKNSNVFINSEGVLNDKSKKSFKGTINFKKGCVLSNGEEKEHAILLSDNCISKASPILLCEEENVTGAHSSSSGKFESDELYYIMSRGFNKKEAINLLVKAKFNNVIKLLDEEDKKIILKEIDRRLI